MKILTVIDGVDIESGTAKDLVFKASALGDEVAVVSTGRAYAPAGGRVCLAFVIPQGHAPLSSRGLASCVVEAARQFGADQVWLPTSHRSGEVAPQVAVGLEGACITDVARMGRDGGGPAFFRPALAGRVVQKVRADGNGPVVVTLRGSAFYGSGTRGSTGGFVHGVVALHPPEGDPRSVFMETLSPAEKLMDMSREKVVVACGRGVNGPEGVSMVRAFAHELGAVLGATRAVVDAGWLPRHAQIGQTGQIIQPDLYIAVGISGAVQHLAGVSGSKCNVAVNRDPEAPIFSVADYGIVGDLFETIPLLREAMGRQGG